MLKSLPFLAEILKCWWTFDRDCSKMLSESKFVQNAWKCWNFVKKWTKISSKSKMLNLLEMLNLS
jgi:hypothetical protein